LFEKKGFVVLGFKQKDSNNKQQNNKTTAIKDLLHLPD